jgi:hypothetical protein
MKVWLLAVIPGALALSACSSSSASGTDNTAPFASNSGSAPGNGLDNQSGDAGQSSSDGDFDPFPLCENAARQRFGFPTNIIINGTYSGEGGPQTFEGEVVIDLRGPPARRFRCALARSAVTSVTEEDASGPANLSGFDDAAPDQ